MHAGDGLRAGEAYRPPLLRLVLSTGAATAWFALLSDVANVYEGLSTLLNLVIIILRNDFAQFLTLFVPILLAFTTALNALVYSYPQWATRWGTWWQVLENLVLVSFIQEPPDVYDGQPFPSSISALLEDVTNTLGDGLAKDGNSLLLFFGFMIFYFCFLIISAVRLLTPLPLVTRAMPSSPYFPW